MTVLLGIVIALVAIGLIGLYTRRRRRALAPLPKDWWTSFERDFRAYANRAERPQPHGHRRHDGRGRRGG